MTINTNNQLNPVSLVHTKNLTKSLSSFTDIFQFFRMYQTYWVELAICVYRHLPIFLSSFSYVPDLLGSKSGTYEKLDKKVGK
jgi:hypothetical protein